MNSSLAVSSSQSSPLHRAFIKVAAAVAMFGVLSAPLHATADGEITKQVWRLKNGVTAAQIVDSVWLNADADGDGATNGEEIAAGTNPFNPSGNITVKSVVLSGGNAQLTFPTEVNKLYRVERATSPASTATWTIQSTGTPASVTGNGSDMTIAVPHSSDSFYRIRVDELDTDGDGVSDWAENVIGLNPNSATTTPGVNDGTYVNSQITLPDEVSIKAVAPFASQDGPTAGSFVVTRQKTLLPLTISLTRTGTATPGTHFSDSLPASVVFAAGESTKTYSVNPTANPVLLGSKSVTETLAAPVPGGAAYTLGINNSATVIINGTTATSGTGLLARYYDTASTTAADAVNFGSTGTYAFTRGTPQNTGSIVVTATPSQFAGLQIGHLVKLTFTSGSGVIDNATFDHQNYTVTAVAAGNFTVAISQATNFSITSTSGSCNFSIQSFPHPAAITRVDSTVNFDWGYGTPNGVTITETTGQTNRPDNYSDTFDTYLVPSTTGNYTFQLDADDKAQVQLDTGTGLVQIVEHNWTTPGADLVGTFKASAPIALTAGQHYRMHVEHVETTGDARCRLQWKVPGTTSFANIPQTNQFTHTQAANYAFTRTNATSGTATVTLTAHGLTTNDSVQIDFTNGTLFTPNTSDLAGYSGSFTATVVDANNFTVPITGTNLPGNQNAGATCILENRPTSTTTGVLNKTYANTTFANTPGRIGVDAAVTAGNNGIWGSGTPDAALINPDTFTVRWTGQVQPQFSETYTFTVLADEGCSLWINGQPQVLKMAPSASNGGSNYKYNSATGDLAVTYTSQPVVPGSFVVGETVRLDLTSGALAHAPTNSPTYTYNSTTGLAVIDYTNLVVGQPGGTRVAGSYAVNEIVELDPTSGSATSLSNLPYQITAVDTVNNTFTVNFGAGLFASTSGLSTDNKINVNDNRNAVITAVHPAVTYSSYNNTTGATVISYSSLAAGMSGSFTVGASIDLEPLSGLLSGATGTYLITAVDTAAMTITVTFPSGLGTTSTSGAMIVRSTPSGMAFPTSVNTAFTVNIGAGKYADTTNSSVNVDIVNKSLKDWSSNGNERFVRIPMQAGVRYDIQLDYYENTSYSRCLLSWYSPSQPKQIIPSERLYPSSGALAPAAHITSTDVSGLVGGPFSQAIAGSNGGTVTISGIPAGLTYSNGVLSGTPTAAGDYQILVTVTNAAGTSSSVVNLHIDNAGGTVAREYWSGVTGTSISDIPVGNTATGSGNLTTLEGPSDFGDNYGARIRGYITAPTTGNYYFWIAANDTAELWISNDDDPINAFKRAWVTTGSATPQTWNTTTSQKSAWLALEQGQKYYFEVLHKAGVGSDNLAVGWAKPGEATNVPSQVVPGYVLSPYVAPAPGSTPGTLLIATMLAQAGANTNGVGNSTLRLSEDESVAYMRFSYSGLTGAISNKHIHIDPNPGHADGEIVYDIDTPATPGDGLITNASDPNYGAYKWTINTVGTYTATQLRDAIKAGKAYINLHTAAYPNGEIRGNYTLSNGTRTFTPPAAPPSWTDDAGLAGAAGDAARVRFLTQATFGANTADIQALKTLGSYEAWIDAEFAKSPTQHLPEVLAREIADVFGPFDVRVTFDTWWKTSMTAPDQLRQRVAFALSEIHVVSGQGPLEDNSRAISHFYDTLAANAFGNFRDVLIGTTLTPGMGRYLDMLRNDKPDQSVGRIPNENYAREIKQLFSIGLYRMWPDGTLMLNSHDAPIDTYTQREIVGLAHVFTGWDYGYDGDYRTGFSAPADWTRPMREIPARHYTGPKRVLNNEVLPGLTTVGGQPLDPFATHISANYNDPAYQALPAQENNAVHDILFNHPNVGPFICRQLIQRMVTSNPSRGYLYRVVQKFNDNGLGVRGDMRAVIKAILLDYEARNTTDELADPSYGKQREPIMRVANAARALRPANVSGSYSQTGLLNSSGVPYILITTSTPHLLSSGNNVFLEFTQAPAEVGDPNKPAPTTGTYAVLSNPAPTSTTYAIAAPGWMAGTYSQSGNTITITMSGHNLPGDNANAVPAQVLQAGNKGQAYFDFTSGGLNGFAGFDQTVRTVVTSTAYDIASGVGNTLTLPAVNGNYSGSTFTITAPDSATRTGNVMISRFGGTYQSTGRNGVITIDTVYGGAGTFGAMADHGLSAGDSVFINFTNSRDTTSFNETSIENDQVYAIASVPDANTFTVPARDAANAAMNSDNQAVVFPLKAQPLTRSGTINARPATYTMDNTDTDLAQTPLNSPTVFNYFLPDYKYAGTLASQGITTPEFQITAETTAVRQANYLYNGVFGSGSLTGISSFNNGNNALVMDLSPWMSNAVGTSGPGLVLGGGPQTGQAWTSNANLGTLIDRFNTLLLAGQLGSTAKAEIQNFIAGQIASFTQTSNTTVTTVNPHNLRTGDTVVISGVSNGTFGGVANGLNDTSTSRAVTVTGPTTFTFTTPLSCTALPTAPGLAAGHVSVVAYNNVTPTAQQQRDRLRAILHFILTSPDYTIQR